MSSQTEVGLSRKKRVFAVVETTVGTLVFPAAGDMIIPAGEANINQTPQFVNSEEIQDTLDIMDQFQNALPPGTWTVPMYLRPSGTIGTVPQGDVLFQSLQGSKNAATTASCSANISISEDNIIFDTQAGGYMPNRGVVTIGTEKIYYSTLTQSTPTSTTGTLSGLTRGYDGTTAASHSDGNDISLNSVYYKQATTSPSFSLWIESDHFIQGMSGCSVNQMTVSLNNEGAVTLNFSGEGMQMVWAGTDALASSLNSTGTAVVVSDADRFSAGARIQNVTKSDTNGGSGYTISSVNTTTNTLTIASGNLVYWATSDVIAGYLPTGTETGDPVEARHTVVDMDGVSTKFRGSDITYNAAKQYLSDEVGTDAPEDFVEDKREITSSLRLYFRKSDAKYFNEALGSKVIALGLTFGETAGDKMVMYFPRCKVQTPVIAGDGPTVAITMGLTMLGTVGEDSCDIVFV